MQRVMFKEINALEVRSDICIMSGVLRVRTLPDCGTAMPGEMYQGPRWLVGL